MLEPSGQLVCVDVREAVERTARVSAKWLYRDDFNLAAG